MGSLSDSYMYMYIFGHVNEWEMYRRHLFEYILTATHMSPVHTM